MQVYTIINRDTNAIISMEIGHKPVSAEVMAEISFMLQFSNLLTFSQDTVKVNVSNGKEFTPKIQYISNKSESAAKLGFPANRECSLGLINYVSIVKYYGLIGSQIILNIKEESSSPATEKAAAEPLLFSDEPEKLDLKGF